VPNWETHQSGKKPGRSILNGRQQAEKQADDRSAQRNDIRKDSVIEIDENENNDCRREREQNDGLQLKPNNRVGRPKDQGCEYLNCRVLPGDRFLAKAALAAQQQVADNGDVVIGFDGFIAFRTARVRKHNRLVCRKPGDADIQKTSDDQAKKNEKEIRHQYCDSDWHNFQFRKIRMMMAQINSRSLSK
jgi:hypothetical protein